MASPFVERRTATGAALFNDGSPPGEPINLAPSACLIVVSGGLAFLSFAGAVSLEPAAAQVAVVGGLPTLSVVGAVSLVPAASQIIISGGQPSLSTGGLTDPALIAALMAYEVEAGVTFQSAIRIILAAVSGRTVGIGTDTEQYLSVDGSVARIVATFDAASNRTGVTLNGG